MPAPDEQPEENPTRRTPTRVRLVEAAADILCREGEAAVTTARAAAAAGIVQSGVYRHFPSAAALLAAAADRAGAEIRRMVEEDRFLKGLAEPGDDPARVAAHFAAMFDLTDGRRTFVELLRRYRGQDSDLGRALAAAHAGLVADVAAVLAGVAAAHGVPDGDAARRQSLAAAVLAVILSAGEAAAGRPDSDRRALAAQTAARVFGLVEGDLRARGDAAG